MQIPASLGLESGQTGVAQRPTQVTATVRLFTATLPAQTRPVPAAGTPTASEWATPVHLPNRVAATALARQTLARLPVALRVAASPRCLCSNYTGMMRAVETQVTSIGAQVPPPATGLQPKENIEPFPSVAKVFMDPDRTEYHFTRTQSVHNACLGDPSPADEVWSSAINADPTVRRASARQRARQEPHARVSCRAQRGEAAPATAGCETHNT